MTTPAFVLKSEFELPGTNAKGYAGIVDYMTDKEKVKKGEAYNTPDYFPEGILSYMADEKKASGLFTKENPIRKRSRKSNANFWELSHEK